MILGFWHQGQEWCLTNLLLSTTFIFLVYFSRVYPAQILNHLLSSKLCLLMDTMLGFSNIRSHSIIVVSLVVIWSPFFVIRFSGIHILLFGNPWGFFTPNHWDGVFNKVIDIMLGVCYLLVLIAFFALLWVAIMALIAMGMINDILLRWVFVVAWRKQINCLWFIALEWSVALWLLRKGIFVDLCLTAKVVWVGIEMVEVHSWGTLWGVPIKDYLILSYQLFWIIIGIIVMLNAILVI